MRAIAVLGAVAWLAGCSKGSGGTAEVALPPASEPALASAPTPTPAPAPDSPAPAGEAHRGTIPRLEADATLRPHLGLLRQHFGPSAAGPFLVQHIDLALGRSAVLVARADESDPMVVVYDRDQALWVKERPAGGVVAPVKHMTLLPKPDGGVVFLTWVASLHLVAARIWADDGNAFGDFQLFAPDACDGLSAAYGPGLGWVVVCSSRDGTRGQRMREDLTMAWGKEGLALGASTPAPVSLVFDSPRSFVLLERVPAVGGDRMVAYRYGAEGQPLWASPADLGMDLAPRSGVAAPGRIDATLARESVVRVARDAGIAGHPATRATEVTAAGDVKQLP